MILAVTGTRQGMSHAQRDKFYRMYEDGLSKNKLFIHGGCVGVDTDAHDLVCCASYPNWRIEVYPSNIFKTWGKDWDGNLTGCKVHPCKGALARNEIMMERADVIVGMPKGMIEERQSGTWHALRCARRLQTRPFKITKTILIIWPNGTVTKDGSNQ